MKKIGQLFWSDNQGLVTKKVSMHAYYSTEEGNVSLCSNKIVIENLPSVSQVPGKNICRSCRKGVKKLKR